MTVPRSLGGTPALDMAVSVTIGVTSAVFDEGAEAEGAGARGVTVVLALVEAAVRAGGLALDEAFVLALVAPPPSPQPKERTSTGRAVTTIEIDRMEGR